MQVYFTFGQSHVHYVNGKKFDKDCVVEIEAENEEKARVKMFDFFGSKWFTSYKSKPDMHFFPRGIIKI